MSAMKMGMKAGVLKIRLEKAYNIAETPVDRMQIEAEELKGRYVKLAAFIDSGKMDEVVNDIYNKCLLEMQCYTMFDYIGFLILAYSVCKVLMVLKYER